MPRRRNLRDDPAWVAVDSQRRYTDHMHAPVRALLRSATMLLLFATALPASAQHQPRSNPRKAERQSPAPKPAAEHKDAPAEPGWLYKGSDIPPDTDWKLGVLPNGVRYALRRNGVPPGQVAIRVRIDAGSLMESDSERGFAHLIEHLTFRGSVYVADGEAKRIWQRLGTTFGSDTNAATTPTATSYKLDLPGATSESLDESLKIMSGMMAQPTLSTEALNAERPVVLAEQREQPGPQVRLTDAIRKLFFAGQPLADRSPIGSIKTLEAATAESVRAFHDRWYRPERTVVVIAGDMDPALMEQLVAKHFSGWKGTGPAPAEPDFGKPDPTQPTVASTVEPSEPTIVSFVVLRPWQYFDDTILFNQKRMVDQLAVRLIDRRLEQSARRGASFLAADVNLIDVSRSANATFVQVQPIGNDWMAALRDVRAVIADAQATPPTEEEIAREVAEWDSAMKNAVDTAQAEAGAAQADNMLEAVDIRETTTTAQISYDILRGAQEKKMFTPEAVLASTRKIFTGDATRALVNVQAPDPTVTAQLKTALEADVSTLAVKRGPIGKVTFDDLPKLGSPGTIASRTPLFEIVSGLGIERIDFANGVRAMIYPNAAEDNRVYVRVRFGGGYNALPANRPTPAWAASLALIAGGIGKLGQEELDQLTTGRRLGFGFGITDDAFLLNALTSPQDLADELTLMATKLAAPGWDPNPVSRARAAALSAFSGYTASPTGILSRDLNGLLHAGDPRWKTPTPEQVKALTAAQFRTFWEPILASGPIEVQVFGDVKADDVVQALARSFGALPPRAAPKRTAPPVKFPAGGKPPLVLTHEGPENQAVAVMAWQTGSGAEGISESRRLDLVAQILSDRLYDRLRSEAGASYSPSVQSNWPIALKNGGRLVAVGQVPPDKVDYFFTLMREIVADLIARPIEADELRRTVVPYIQYISRSATGNTFWLNQLEGSTFDAGRLAIARGLRDDLANITSAQIQAVAAKYLKPEAAWTMSVVPKAAASANKGAAAK